MPNRAEIQLLQSCICVFASLIRLSCRSAAATHGIPATHAIAAARRIAMRSPQAKASPLAMGSPKPIALFDVGSEVSLGTIWGQPGSICGRSGADVMSIWSPSGTHLRPGVDPESVPGSILSRFFGRSGTELGSSLGRLGVDRESVRGRSGGLLPTRHFSPRSPAAAR